MSLVLVFGLSASALGQSPPLLDFEDLSVGTGVFQQYPGVTFRDGDTSPPRTLIVQHPEGTTSGTHAVQATKRGEFVGSGMRLLFDEGQARVKLSVGLGDTGVDHTGLLVVLRGYDTATPSADQLLAPVAESSIVFLGSPPRAVDTPLELRSAGADVVRVDLVILGQNWETSFPESPDQVAVVIDNLEYTPPDDPPVPDTVQPAVTIDTPFDRETVAGSAPGALETYVRGHIDEAHGLLSLTLQLNGGVERTVGHDGNVGGRYPFLATIFGQDGLVDGENEVVIRAGDFAGNTNILFRRFVYAATPVPAPTDTDLVPIGVELNQGISPGPFGGLAFGTEGYVVDVPEWANVVEDTDTLVRIYAVAEGTPSPVVGVPARMEVYRDDCASDCRLGELSPMASATRTRGGIRVRPAGTDRSTLASLAKQLSDTWNFLIPAAWAHEPLRLLIDINTPTSTGFAPVPECVADFLGECERGNRVEVHVSFEPQHVATVNPILVRFVGQFEGNAIDEEPTAADVAAMVQDLNALYPTRFDVGPTRRITVDPNISGGALLDTLQDRFGCVAADIWSASTWGACGFDPTVFHVALVPNTYDLGSGGLANRGNNTVWAMISRTAPAHEVGHAIGFLHATCDHEEAAGGDCDPYVPGVHGRLGGIGFDRSNWSLVVDRSPDHAHDLMSYGGSAWASRYMWRITANHPFVDGVDYEWCYDLLFDLHRCGIGQDPVSSRSARAAPDGPVLLVRGRIDASGHVGLSDAVLKVVGGTPPAPTPGAPTYWLEALDAQGNTLVSQPVQPRETLGGADPSSRFLEELALPDGDDLAIDALQVRNPDGDVIGVLQARSNQAPAVAIDTIGAAGSWSRDEVRRIGWTMSAGATAQVELQLAGKPGVVLGRQMVDPGLDVSVADLPSSPEARIVVRVSDGIHTGVATSASFEIPPGPPTAQIITPTDPLVVDPGVVVSFFGAGSTPDGPLGAEGLSWSADTLGDLGTGRQIAVAELPEGVHLVTLRAEGPDGQASTSTVRVTVGTDLGLKKGCGCSTSPSPAWLWLGMLGLVGLRRRGRPGHVEATARLRP